jgi:hypothetical protein
VTTGRGVVGAVPVLGVVVVVAVVVDVVVVVVVVVGLVGVVGGAQVRQQRGRLSDTEQWWAWHPSATSPYSQPGKEKNMINK